MNMVQPYPQAQ